MYVRPLWRKNFYIRRNSLFPLTNVYNFRPRRRFCLLVVNIPPCKPTKKKLFFLKKKNVRKSVFRYYVPCKKVDLNHIEFFLFPTDFPCLNMIHHHVWYCNRNMTRMTVLTKLWWHYLHLNNQAVIQLLVQILHWLKNDNLTKFFAIFRPWTNFHSYPVWMTNI